MFFVIYQIFVIRKIANNCRRQKFNNYRTFTLPNFASFASRYSLFDLICCSLCAITCLNYTNSKYSITTLGLGNNYAFYKPFVNFIFIGLDTIFNFDQYEKLRKSKYRYIFIAMYVYIVLDKKLIDVFRKTILPIICAILKIYCNKNLR